MTSQTRNIYEGDHPDAAIYAPALGVNYRRRLRKESFGSGRSSPSSSLESTRSNSSSSLASSMMTLTSVDSRWGDHSFSTYFKFFEKLTFLPP